MHVNITGFQRMRRLGEENVAQPNPEKSIGKDFDKNEANLPGDNLNAADGQETPNNEVKDIEQNVDVDNQDNEQTAGLTAEQVDELDIEQVKEELEKREIQFAHNTGLEKLKTKLKEAL